MSFSLSSYNGNYLNTWIRGWIERFYTFFTQFGSHLTGGLALAMQQIQESGLAMEVLRGWMTSIIWNISQVAPKTRTSLFIKLAYLSNLLSHRGPAENLTPMRSLGLHAPQAWLFIHPRTAPLRHRRAHYIVNDLLDAFEASKPWALYSAMQYLGYRICFHMLVITLINPL